MEPTGTGSIDNLQDAQQASTSKTSSRSVGRALAKGAVAGVVATSAMVAVRDAMWKRESAEVRGREERLREDASVTPLQRPIRKAASAMGRPLDEDTEQKVGRAMAWGLGIGGVAAYAALRERYPAIRMGQGSVFGAAMWAIEDEGLVQAIASPHPPGAYPWQAHARGLVSHVAYGLAAETTLEAFDRFA